MTKTDRSVRLIPERHVTRQLTEQVGSRDRNSFIPMFSKLPVFLLLQFPDGVLCEHGVGMVCGCAAVKRRSSDHASLRSVSSDPDSPPAVSFKPVWDNLFLICCLNIFKQPNAANLTLIKTLQINVQYIYLFMGIKKLEINY